MEDRRETIPWSGLVHLFVVCVVWGGTYLAIRMAVHGEGGFAPFFLGAARTLTAAAVLFGWNLWRQSRLRPTRDELRVLIASGLLLWVGGNGLVNWAETRADSGFAALLVGTLPMWVALIESIIDRRRPTLELMAALAVGFAGLFALTYPVLRHGFRAELGAVIALLAAPLCWGIGSVLQTRRPVGLSPTASSAYQQLIGGTGFLLVSLLMREPSPHPVARTWLAWGYLVVFGSLIAFTSFVQALRLLPVRIVSTYSYVNPVIAVFLGWLVLGERITPWTAGGTALILLGVAGVFHTKTRRVRTVLHH